MESGFDRQKGNPNSKLTNFPWLAGDIYHSYRRLVINPPFVSIRFFVDLCWLFSCMLNPINPWFWSKASPWKKPSRGAGGGVAPASGTAALPSGGGTQKGAPKVKERSSVDSVDSEDGFISSISLWFIGTYRWYTFSQWDHNPSITFGGVQLGHFQ